MHFAIFTGGALKPGKAVKTALSDADIIIAADSGAETALSFNVVPKIILGDLDSLNKKIFYELKAKKCKFITSPHEKNETDTELAIKFAVSNKATRISVLGGIEGNRIDHILANIFILSSFSVPIKYINGHTIVWLEKGPKKVEIKGELNDLLSLIPLTADVPNITTRNLHYPLSEETLFFEKSRGISNVFSKKNVFVNFSKGSLLFIHMNKKELIENS